MTETSESLTATPGSADLPPLPPEADPFGPPPFLPLTLEEAAIDAEGEDVPASAPRASMEDGE